MLTSPSCSGVRSSVRRVRLLKKRIGMRLLAAVAGFQRLDPARERFDRVVLRIRHIDVWDDGFLDFLTVLEDDASGHADNRAVRWNVLHDDRPGCDFCSSTDGDRSENDGAGSDHHAVFERRMALAALQARAAERHALIERAVAADFGGLSDDDTRSVVDEQSRAEFSPRVDFDAGEEPRDIREKTRQNRNAPSLQRMDETIREHRMKTGIAQEHVERIARSRIAREARAPVCGYLTEDRFVT